MRNHTAMEACVRRASVADLEGLLPLVAAYREFYKQAADEPRERELMTDHLARGTSVVFVACLGEKIAGFVQMFQTLSTVMLGPQLILEDLFVDPAARRAGIASALLERAAAHAREIGATGMFLETAMDNQPAQRVYERAGWTREGRFFKYNAPL
jgi:ribosomal protein S18 acetylase RimI-like enzyme